MTMICPKTMRECHSTAMCSPFGGCSSQQAGFQQPQSEEADRAYQRGWDDCLLRVYQTLGEKFTLPKGLPSAADMRGANKPISAANRLTDPGQGVGK